MNMEEINTNLPKKSTPKYLLSAGLPVFIGTEMVLTETDQMPSCSTLILSRNMEQMAS